MLNPIQPMLRAIENKYIDIKYNINTFSKNTVDELAIESSNKTYSDIYKTISEREFLRITKILPVDLSGYHFIDIGSGKGRILFLAAQLNFKKITGIEFSPLLFQYSVENIRNYGLKFKEDSRINVIYGDATKALSLDPGQSYVLFFFNPFRGDITKQIVDILNTWHNFDKTSTIYIVWYNCHPAKTDVDPLFNVDWLVSVDGISSLSERPHGTRYVVFKNK